MMKTKPVATTLLIVMAIIFLISYPHRHDALWAFIMHVSGAAMIGGLADWYAVTALFTKPLGIPFKTAILPRSKERLIQIGRTMLSEELLRVPQMYYAIKRERVMVRIIEYGMSDVGQKQMRELLYGVGNQVLSHMDIEPMRKEINKAVYKGYPIGRPHLSLFYSVVACWNAIRLACFGFILIELVSVLSRQIRCIHICIASC